MIELVDVYKAFGDLVVLDGVSLRLERGKTTSLIGPSGTGKSVLLKIIVGLLQPDSGQVLIDGVDMARASHRQKLELRRKFGMLFQDGALFDSLTAGENVAFPLRYHTKLSAVQRRAVAQQKLDIVELGEAYDRPTPALSGGQRKRVGLARAIVMEPQAVLFDEPNSGLDPVTSDTIDALIGRMKRALGITFVVITHDIVQALSVSDRVGMLHGGKLIAFGTTEELVANPNEVVQRFLARNLAPPRRGAQPTS